VMLTQGSSACACAGGMQRGARAMAAAATDVPTIARFISYSFPDALHGPVVVATNECRTLSRNSYSLSRLDGRLNDRLQQR
jgi:hypothetical protein